MDVNLLIRSEPLPECVIQVTNVSKTQWPWIEYDYLTQRLLSTRTFREEETTGAKYTNRETVGPGCFRPKLWGHRVRREDVLKWREDPTLEQDSGGILSTDQFAMNFTEVNVEMIDREMNDSLDQDWVVSVPLRGGEDGPRSSKEPVTVSRLDFGAGPQASMAPRLELIVSPNSWFSKILKKREMSERVMLLHRHLLQKLEYDWHLLISRAQPRCLTCGVQASEMLPGA
ncbi:hypothetical protein MJG53_014193 [Ovis ammon polii x Ovis aries]|uniref:Uncharacterized protein n=1 Tax=Ovis ammon polii x Ovis aries TaxID=2918886 RepID=A0ACB9UFY9_9CETA|nr:hypothetical protein MJG53_014193 [Ovis ammon polii x Ovis aries]